MPALEQPALAALQPALQPLALAPQALHGVTVRVAPTIPVCDRLVRALERATMERFTTPRDRGDWQGRQRVWQRLGGALGSLGLVAWVSKLAIHLTWIRQQRALLDASFQAHLLNWHDWLASAGGASTRQAIAHYQAWQHGLYDLGQVGAWLIGAGVLCGLAWWSLRPTRASRANLAVWARSPQAQAYLAARPDDVPFLVREHFKIDQLCKADGLVGGVHFIVGGLPTAASP